MTAGAPNAMDCSCSDAKCACCQRWVTELGKTPGGKDVTATAQDKRIADMQAKIAELSADVARYKKANQELTAEKNGIKTVTASEPKEPGRRGRPPGQKTTINKRPEKVDRVEVNDFDKCPKCGSHEVSDTVTDRYDRIVKTTHIVRERQAHRLQAILPRLQKAGLRSGAGGGPQRTHLVQLLGHRRFPEHVRPLARQGGQVLH